MKNYRNIIAAMTKAKMLFTDASGATAIEYALIAGLIFLAIVGALNFYADSMGNMYNGIRNSVTDVF